MNRDYDSLMAEFARFQTRSGFPLALDSWIESEKSARKRLWETCEDWILRMNQCGNQAKFCRQKQAEIRDYTTRVVQYELRRTNCLDKLASALRRYETKTYMSSSSQEFDNVCELADELASVTALLENARTHLYSIDLLCKYLVMNNDGREDN